MSAPGRQRRPKEIFIGPRLRVQVAPLVRVRSGLVLAFLSLLMGAALAAGLAAGIGYGAQAVLHSFGTSF